MAVRAEAMDRLIEVTGIVLSSSPVGDYDRRVVILTRERGKLHAFARGSRRPGSPLMAGIRPFSFGVFTLYEGQSALSIRQIAISNYFEEITSDMELVFLGSYFLEFADYYSRENGDEFATLKLLYQTLRALPKKSLDNRLVRLVYGKYQLYESRVRIFPENGFRHFCPQRQVDGTDDNGLSGSRLPGEDIESGTEVHLRFPDQRQILHVQIQ